MSILTGIHNQDKYKINSNPGLFHDGAQKALDDSQNKEKQNHYWTSY